jgi:NAD(P)-dependent dehydrogenase (short-subunit alcohol dehydrogenase family)
VTAPVEFLPIDRLRETIEVNAIAPVRLTQQLLPLLRARSGRCVYIGAGQGRVSLPFGGAYSASKFALTALTDALRAELAGSGVHISLIEPGAIRTAILQRSRDDAAATLAAMPAEGRERYESGMTGMLDTAATAFERALPPSRVADTVLAALTSRSPKPRYLIGREARALAVLAVLPARWRARLAARIAG